METPQSAADTPKDDAAEETAEDTPAGYFRYQVDNSVTLLDAPLKGDRRAYAFTGAPVQSQS